MFGWQQKGNIKIVITLRFNKFNLNYINNKKFD